MTPRVEQLEKSVADISVNVNKLTSMMEEVITNKSFILPAAATVAGVVASELPTFTDSANTVMMHPGWRKVIDYYLGTDFDAKVVSGSDSGFSVLVTFPEHIDRRIGQDKQSGPRDTSMMSPIHLASPIADIECWCKLIVERIKEHPSYKNFTPKH